MGLYIGVINRSLYRIHTRIRVLILIYIYSFFIPFLLIFIFYFWKREKERYIRCKSWKEGRVAEWQAWQSKNKYLYTKENLEIQ